MTWEEWEKVFSSQNGLEIHQDGRLVDIIIGDHEINLTQVALAKHIGVLPKTINEICRRKRGISAEMAVKLSKALGGHPQFWLNLHNNWIKLLLKTLNESRPKDRQSLRYNLFVHDHGWLTRKSNSEYS